jgi:RNA polymerase sigma-70 factor, ECF subfamily
VHAAQRGDTSAFAELYRRYAGMVRAIALVRLRTDEIADAVQETFLRALRRLNTLRKADAFGTWIAVIARNVVRDLERTRVVQTAEDEEPLGAATQQHQAEARAALRAIRSLPKAYRKTVAMRVVRGMTGPEIAHCTGHSAGSVRVNLHRGMKLLRKQLEAAALKARDFRQRGVGGPRRQSRHVVTPGRAGVARHSFPCLSASDDPHGRHRSGTTAADAPWQGGACD